jgi:pSer/pThr/pTyr-binding forkhead associated (FHA) protein
MPAQLVALTDGPSILLDKPILLLGRHPECDIAIDSRKISRRHCCIAQVNDYLVVRDLGSTNGVRINGVRIVEGRLKPGDELTIGNHRYQVRLEGAGPLSPPPNGKRRPSRTSVPERAGYDDAQLESCDDPVPIPESNERVAPAPAVQAIPAAPPPRPVTPRGEAGPILDSPSPLRLPDHLELAPASDPFPPAPSSHSHHPS